MTTTLAGFDNPQAPEADTEGDEGLDLSKQQEEELNAELDALIAEDVAGKPPVAADDMSELDDLLEEAMAGQRDAAAAKAARERLKRGGLSAAERAEDAARIAAWEAAHEWEAVASVAVWHQLRCSCVTAMSVTVFQGLFTRETHRRLKALQRWRRVEAADAKLPPETAIRVVPVPMCAACSEGKGWSFDNAYLWKD